MLKDNLPLDRIFGGIDFAKLAAVVVAISGGSDSTALLFLLQEYCQKCGPPPRIIAVTVDHQIRSESSREALEVHALCTRKHIEHRTECWLGEKPATGIQAAARSARYELLSKVAVEVGASLVLTGHTFDDQLETVAMRERRDGGADNFGLAGIAPATLSFNDRGGGEPVWFVRPLLSTRRQALRDYLQERGLGWIDDPSNQNQDYERVAVRHALGSEDHAELMAMQQAMALRRYTLSHEASQLIELYAHEIEPGLVYVTHGMEASEAAKRALGVLIAFAGGAPWAAEKAIAEAVQEGAAAFSSGQRTKPLRITASGALIDVRKAGIYLMREMREPLEGSKRSQMDRFYGAVANFPSPRSLRGEGARRADEGLRQDLKEEFESTYDMPEIFTGAPSSGAAPHPALRATFSPQDAGRSKEAIPPSLLTHARATHPVIESAAKVRRLINPWPYLMPLFDFEMAQSLAKMAGLPSLPAIPIHFDDKN